MVPRAGFEPATCPLGGDRAIQLCHRSELVFSLTILIAGAIIAAKTGWVRGRIDSGLLRMLQAQEPEGYRAAWQAMCWMTPGLWQASLQIL